MKLHPLLLSALLLPLTGFAQVNSGSDGHDGALNPASNLVIDMADHPDGIYHYTSVNIPAGVSVSFIPNAGNKPVVWLVQGAVVISGTVNIFGADINGPSGQTGGPGGYSGGFAPTDQNPPQPGLGPGGGRVDANNISGLGSNAAFGTAAQPSEGGHPFGEPYGNKYLLPLQGGSGGSGGGNRGWRNGGGGGGGALLIASSSSVQLNGSIAANGGSAGTQESILVLGGGGGSGGAVRIVSPVVNGSGSINVSGGVAGLYTGYQPWLRPRAGGGRIRIDTFDNQFNGSAGGSVSVGFQPIILPAPGQGIQLAIQSVGGVAVAANPSGVLANPDVIVPAQQTNPVSIVVSCTNVALNSEVTVVVQPANGAAVQAVGLNHAGTAAASTATVSLNMPRGGGIIYAKAVTGLAGTASTGSGDAVRSLAQTGWTATGERFKAIEVTAALGGAQRVAYITESGKRYEAN